MTEKPRETQAESHVVELKEKVNNSSLMKHQKSGLAPSLAFARGRALARLHLSVVSKPSTNPVCIDTISDNLFSARCTSSLAATCKRRKMSMMAEKGETIVRNMHGRGQGGEIAKHVRCRQ